MSVLFEPSWGLIQLIINGEGIMARAQGLRNYGDFIELVRSELVQKCVDVEVEIKDASSSQYIELLKDVVNAHPRLGESKKQLSTHSLLEQRNLQNGQDSPEVTKRLQELNKEYEKVYPGLRFVLFVNGRNRPEVIGVMESRISSGNSWFKEMETAIQELCNIAQDRYHKSKSRF